MLTRKNNGTATQKARTIQNTSLPIYENDLLPIFDHSQLLTNLKFHRKRVFRKADIDKTKAHNAALTGILAPE